MMTEPEEPTPDSYLDDDELFAELERDDDEEMSYMREKRMNELRAEMAKVKDMAGNRHGTYEDIMTEKEILDITTKTDKCIVHFYHKEFRRCKLMDKHLEILSRKHFTTRFVKIDVERCPFLVERLKVQVLPCVLCFIKGISVDRLVGFEELGESDDFQTTVLERRLNTAKVISLESDKPAPRKTIFGFNDNKDGDDDDDDYDD
ncbi:hypothetical protein HDU76_004506 [Blyttiomyces sp. JEL0837]|nr:hypothetical protein HDU76_004506 [Blyttiomyces sp. JEL0837]